MLNLRTVHSRLHLAKPRLLLPLTPSSCRSYTTRSASDHHDLSSFLMHAERTGLSPTSTLYVGTHYEYIVQQALARFGLTLSRTGGRFDRGIDLMGTWHLPSLPPGHPLRMLVQCKATNRKAGPNLVRELEGTFAGVPARWLEEDEGTTPDVQSGDVAGLTAVAAGKASGTMALLVAPKDATKGVRDTLGRSNWPMGFAKVTLDGIVEQMLWNRSAAAKGLEGLAVTPRFRPMRQLNSSSVGEDGVEDDGLQQEIVLIWDGSIWEGHHGQPARQGAAVSNSDDMEEVKEASST